MLKIICMSFFHSLKRSSNLFYFCVFHLWFQHPSILKAYYSKMYNRLLFLADDHYVQVTTNKVFCYYNKMKNNNYHAVRTVLKEKYILLTHIYALPWLGTDTSIKSGRVKLVLWSQTYIIINFSGKRNLLNKQDKINP